MATWQTSTTVSGDPVHVIAVLTDPDACRRWSPIQFDLEELEGRRLAAGIHARVTGLIAGQRVGFEIEVLAADEQGLWLRATGPIEIEVEYGLVALEGATEIDAQVSVAPRGGLVGRVLSRATDGLLAAGMLDAAVGRIAREVEAPLALAA